MPLLVTCVRETLRACWKIRSPESPVSRSMSLIVWHVEVAGVQIVTLTQGLLM
jgi:hypothetical protein